MRDMHSTDSRNPSAFIETIAVPEWTAVSAAPHDLPEAVSLFIDHALSREYIPEELPREALVARWLFIYEG